MIFINAELPFKLKRIGFLEDSGNRVRVSFVHPDLSGDVELAVEFEDSISPTTPICQLEKRTFQCLIRKFCINLLEKAYDDLLERQ